MTESDQNAVIIVAAGRGARAGEKNRPKQYRLLDGQSVLDRTISAFADHPAIDLIQVVIHADDVALYDENTAPHTKLQPPCTGGETRQASVLAGLVAMRGRNTNKVIIHDAARPFVSAPLISRVLNHCSKENGALPVLPVTDTIKEGKDGRIVKTIPRDHLFAAQTPQGFAYAAILKAHQKAAKHDAHSFTDDAAIAEWAGIPMNLIEGDAANRKLTYEKDFFMAEETSANHIPDIRTGNGYDVHAFEPGTSVRLCGVDIAHNASLKGHSDADVGLHALTDALLGTIGEGDIGTFFPPSDSQWRNVNSDVFLGYAVDQVANSGGTITHLDVTLICEAPKIAPHRHEMREKIASVAKIDVGRVSVKATTNERIGFIGRQEGIASLATATVVFNNAVNA